MTPKLVIQRIPWEAWIWTAGLVFLALNDSSGSWSVCPLHNFGIDFCPGCGLGRSVSHLFHGEWAAAWSVHPLGYAAVPVLAVRSYTLFKKSLNNNNNHHGKSIRPVT